MDKRKHVRVPFAGKAKLSIENCKPVDVTISNMSLAGLLFHSSKDFDLGKLITVQVSGVFREKSFKEMVSGRIVTVHRGPVGNSFGLQFLAHLTEERSPSLVGWIDDYDEAKPMPSFLRNSSGAV